MRKIIFKKLNQAFDLMGPGTYSMSMIVEMINSLMPTPRWNATEVSLALRGHPRVEYLGRSSDHSRGKSLYRVIA